MPTPAFHGIATVASRSTRTRSRQRHSSFLTLPELCRIGRHLAGVATIPPEAPAHDHGQLEFLLILRGTAVERIGQTEVTVHAGQLVWHLPGVAHEMVAVSADLDLRVVQLEPDLALAAQPPATSSVKLLTQSSEHPFSRWVGALGALAAGRAVVELKRRDQLLLLEDCDLASTDEAVSRGAHAARLRRLFSKALTATRIDHDTS